MFKNIPTNLISPSFKKSIKKNRYHKIFDSNGEYKWERRGLLLVRFISAILTGIITAVILNWYLFFVIIGGYCLFEFIVVFGIVKQSQLIASELEHEGRTLTASERTQFSSHSSRYALAYALVGFYLSFVMITVCGTLAEWITEVVVISIKQISAASL